MEGEQRYIPHEKLPIVSSEENSSEELSIHDAQEWFKHVEDLNEALEVPNESSDPYMKVDAKELNPKLDLFAAQQNAYRAATSKTPRFDGPKPPKQAMKQKKPGVLSRLLSWFTRPKKKV